MAEEKIKKPRRIPLTIKWTAFVTLGIFLTFTLLAVGLATATREILIGQETENVRSTLRSIERRFAEEDAPLSPQSVAERLNAPRRIMLRNHDVTAEEQPGIFDENVQQSLARQDVSLAVYDAQGKLLFSSRHDDQTLTRTDEEDIQRLAGHFDGLVGSSPIRSLRSGRVIGYVQVTNRMSVVSNMLKKVWLWISILAGIGLLLAVLIGYVLTRSFLKPIHLMTQTIDAINEEPQSTTRIPERKANDELGDLIREFNAMLDRIQRFIDSQSDFVQDVSHELRTPVAILEGHLQLLNRWGKDDPEVLAESLAASLQEVSRMKNLIQEMLDLTRADQVDVQYPNAVVNLNQTVHQVVSDFVMIHPDFVFTLDDDLEGEVWIRMYRNHLEQVLIILLDNAVKYSTNRREVHITASQSVDGAAIAVQDFGEGISQKDRDRVFNRFYRVDKARSREKGGNGLGLSIAKQLIENYNGTLTVDSVLGSGSSFRIDLPIISANKAEQLKQLAERQEVAQKNKPEDTTISSNL